MVSYQRRSFGAPARHQKSCPIRSASALLLICLLATFLFLIFLWACCLSLPCPLALACEEDVKWAFCPIASLFCGRWPWRVNGGRIRDGRTLRGDFSRLFLTFFVFFFRRRGRDACAITLSFFFDLRGTCGANGFCGLLFSVAPAA